MKKVIISAALMALSFAASAMGPDYKKMPNGGYVYTGGAHVKGCSDRIQVGVSSQQFVIDCMKIDSKGVKTPDRRRSITNRYGRRDIVTYGMTTFYFQNNVLETIAQ
jgi:hypothetical protein